ncbi:MAG: DUF6034 family protein [Eubacteriales bacterium]|nr:DUF6034 family protein [Eubacteriales bacterium]
MTVLYTLLEITIYSAILFGAVWLFRALLKKHLSPMLLYMAWFIVIARLLMPVTVASGFSLFVIPSAEESAAQTESADLSELLNGLNNTVVLDQSESQTQTYSDVQQSETSQTQTAQNAVAETTTSAANAPLEITWETALIALWLMGMAVMLIQMGVSTIRLKKRLKNAGSVPPEWQRMAEDIESELGLRRSVRVVMIAGFPSPALSAGIRPVVVLPEEMLEKTDALVRFALLHEMTHIKRKDHIVSLLLLLLRAVYWFNPIVWLTVRQMRLDMETACDSTLTRPMSTSDRKQYASTILSMFARKQVRYVLGMSLGQTKKTAERRLRGVFMRGKSSRKAHVTALILTAVLLISCFTTACQPTPEEEIVVGKDQDEMLSAAAQTQEAESEMVSEQVDAPETYTANVTAAEGKLNVIADNASVILPNVDAIPILRVEAADFTQAQVDGLISALLGGQTIYEVTYGADTKDEIMQQILNLKRLKETDEYASEGDQAQLSEDIEMLEAKYEQAPETSEDITVESDGQLKQEELTDYETGAHIAYYMGLNATTNPDDYTKAARILVQNNNDMTQSIVDVRTDEDGNITGMSGRFVRRMAMLKYENRGDASGSNFAQHTPISVAEDTVIDDPEVLAKLATTPGGAKALVEDMLARAGIDNMTVVAMYLTDDENLGNYDGLVLPAEHYAYKLILCRTVDGVPVSYIRCSSGGGADMENRISAALESGDEDAVEQAYSNMAEWAYETIDVMVDDTGIISLDWYSPLELGDIVVENAALLPFADIADKFEKQMKIEWETQANGEGLESISFTVDHVSLEYQRIAEQDALDSGLLVPVWNFYGTCTAPTSDGGDVGSSFLGGDDYYSNPMMTINAIDGSIIDIVQGY